MKIVSSLGIFVWYTCRIYFIWKAQAGCQCCPFHNGRCVSLHLMLSVLKMVRSSVTIAAITRLSYYNVTVCVGWGGLGLIIMSNLNWVRLSCCWVGLWQYVANFDQFERCRSEFRFSLISIINLKVHFLKYQLIYKYSSIYFVNKTNTLSQNVRWSINKAFVGLGISDI